jgi:uncharacterized protein (TIGR00251 family)
VRLRIRVQPGARREGLERAADGVVKVKVREPAREGRANAAVTELLAELLGVSRGAVQVVRGAGSREKTIEVRGLASEALASKIGAVLAEEKGKA